MTIRLWAKILLAAAFCFDGSAGGKAANPADAGRCRHLWAGIGLPALPEDVLLTSDYTYVCHNAYVLLHDNRRRSPVAVVERLVTTQVAAENTRPDQQFRPDGAILAINPDFSATDKDYRNSRFDRGHQAPSADFAAVDVLMRESFLFSNAVPQQGIGFNRHIWARLEELVRKLVRERGEIYVITGPIHPAGGNDPNQSIEITESSNLCGSAILFPLPPKPAVCAANNDNPAALCGESGVAVPAGMFKVIYDPKRGRANAYAMPNINHNPLLKKADALTYLDQYRVPVELVETLTGLSLFSGLDERARRPKVVHCTARMLH